MCRKGASAGRIPGRRVDPESGAIQKGGFFGCFDIDARAALTTRIIQKQDRFGRMDTDERIGPDTGKLQERGWFGWKDRSQHAVSVRRCA
jgi:hypothetical protein